MTESNISTQYLNFKLIKNQTDVVKLFDFLNLGDTYELNKDNDELVGICPLSNEKHGDENSFSFNVKKKTFQCFACKKRGSVIDFIKYMREANGGKLNLRESAKVLSEINKQIMGEEAYAKDLVQSYKEQVAIKKNSGATYENKQEIEQDRVADTSYIVTETVDQDQRLIDAGREALQRKLSALKDQQVINKPDFAKEIAELKTGSLAYESIGMILGNTKHNFIDYVELAKGSTGGAVVSINYIVRSVINKGAAVVILCHNHPSGSAEASRQDIAITNKVKDALDLIDVRLLDHIIVASPTISMAEQGLI